jgi:putative photosynthetic complex assembly protein 2
MIEHGWPFAYTLFVWWFSTGVILYLDGLPQWTFKWTMTGSTIVLACALYGLVAIKNDTSIFGAYLAFTCSVLVWAWQEVAFLLGYITGPRRIACPAGASGWRRLKFALSAVLHHELALIALAAAVIALSWNGSNLTGLWTFFTLWLMRQSAKLNIYLGARNWSESFLPAHLHYLQSYFARKPMNPLFPVSVVVATTLATLLWQSAFRGQAGWFEAASLTFVATLMSLAVLEHWFMMLPFPPETLWRWAIRKPAEPAWRPSPALK